MAEGGSDPGNGEESWESWFGGWVQAAKEKSNSALELVKKDLSEFSATMQKETERAVDFTKASINNESATEATKKVRAGLTSLLDNISKALVVPPDDDDSVPMKVAADGSGLYDRGKARLHALQLDVSTYMDEPRGPPEQFNLWLESFVLDDHKGEISELLVSKVEVRALYTKLVPNEVSHASFWQRYFYRIHQLECDEARKQALMKRAEQTRGDSINWDDDEDSWSGDEDEGNHSDWEKMPRPPQSEAAQMKETQSTVTSEPEKAEHIASGGSENSGDHGDQETVSTSAPIASRPVVPPEESGQSTESHQPSMQTSVSACAAQPLPGASQRNSESETQSSALPVNHSDTGISQTDASACSLDSAIAPSDSSQETGSHTGPDNTSSASHGAEEAKDTSVEGGMLEMLHQSSNRPETPNQMSGQGNDGCAAEGGESADVVPEAGSGDPAGDACGAVGAEPVLALRENAPELSANQPSHAEYAASTQDVSESARSETDQSASSKQIVRNDNEQSTDIPISKSSQSPVKENIQSEAVSLSDTKTENSPSPSESQPATENADPAATVETPVAGFTPVSACDNSEENTAETKTEAVAVADQQKEIAMRVKGDMVVVGDRESPSSSESSDAKETGLSDDWEQDFDIELTEEDLKAAEDIAKKLGENLGTGEDDDWENWE